MFRKTVRDLNAGAVFRLWDSAKRNPYYEITVRIVDRVLSSIRGSVF
jgi:hypothetical protein